MTWLAMAGAVAGPEPVLGAPDGGAAGRAGASELARPAAAGLRASRLGGRRDFGDGCRISTAMGGRSVDLADGLAGVASAAVAVDGVCARAAACDAVASTVITASLRTRANLMQPPPHRRRRNARPEIPLGREAAHDRRTIPAVVVGLELTPGAV
ncbi:MAG: hypothetical protein P4M07_21345 [Xanthobacteraceae bacterium]|nr:hypothetical protein [Xanthobacteraceae bacterium]